MNIPTKTILNFALRFMLAATIIWPLWWYILPHYGWLIGQLSGTLISFPGGMKIDALLIETRESLMFNANTFLVFTHVGTEHPFHIASLISNIPPYFILILATPGIKLKKGLRALLIGLPIIATGHIAFITLTFILQTQIQKQPEIPTGIGYVFLTLPFILWITLVHWETISDYLNTTEADSTPDA